MSKLPDEKTEKLAANPKASLSDSSEPKEQPASNAAKEATEANSVPPNEPENSDTKRETAADIFRREVANNPRFVEIKGSGRGYVFGGGGWNRKTD